MSIPKTTTEFFAGVGGFRIGLEKADPSWKTMFFSQYEPGRKNQFAYDCYVRNFGLDSIVHPELTNVDINDVDKNLLPATNLLTGGFPCQSFSVARPLSLSTGMDDPAKGQLWYQLLDTLNAKKIPFGLFENVDRLLASPHAQPGRDFGMILASLAASGYSCEWRVINAADYGMQQKRRRTYIFAYKNGTRFQKSLSAISPFDVLSRDGFFASSFPVQPIDEDAVGHVDIDYKNIEMVRTTFAYRFGNAGYMTEGSVYETKITPVYEKPVTLGSLLESDVDERFYLTDSQLAQFKKLKGAMKVPRVSKTGHEYVYSQGACPFPDNLDGPARTIITSEGGVSRTTHTVRDPKTGRIRFLTPVEGERIQGFPDGHTDGMTDRQRMFCVGNALVVPVITRIGKKIDEIFDNEPSDLRDDDE